jgi:hypothetical protein
MKFLKDKLKPENFNDSDSQSSVLRFCTGSRDSIFFLCTPRNEIMTKIYTRIYIKRRSSIEPAQSVSL